MWIIESIFNLKENYNVDHLRHEGGKYSIKFYNTDTKEREEIILRSTIGEYQSWNISTEYSHKYHSWEGILEIIYNRFDWDLEKMSPALYVTDKYFMRIEEKLEMITPPVKHAIYWYNAEYAHDRVESLQSLFDLHYLYKKGKIIDGVIKIDDAEFKLLCSEEEFNKAVVKYRIAGGK